ncbi:MAG TPA: hypothetical protein ENI15_14630 [Spirochaetes bacterium]|nr:hypothetical protein [Spirochaetota bacterium]
MESTLQKTYKQKALKERKSPRIERLKKRYFSDRLYVDSRRALLVTESYRETGGEPVVIRRARALEKILGDFLSFKAFCL